MAVDAIQIANLLAIARHGSFTRAAEEKGMSQPALSNSIALLEQRLGVRVLERSRRGSALTPYGEILVRRAEGLQALLDDAEAEVRMHAAGTAGPIRIGATPSVLPKLLPLALARLVAAEGPVDIEIVEQLDQALVPMLRSGALDIIVGPVGEMFTSSDDITEVPLLADPFAIGVGSLSPYRNHTTLTLATLRDAPWILPHPGSTYRRHVEAMFVTAGISWPRNCIHANALPLIEALLLSTDRVTIVSPIQITPAGTAISIIPLKGGSGRSIGYKVRRQSGITSLGERFIKHLTGISTQISVA